MDNYPHQIDPAASARLVMTSVRLDRKLHSELRQIAFEHRKSMHSLLIEGAESIRRRYGEEPPPAAAE